MIINLHKIFLVSLFYLAPFIDSLSGYLVLSGLISEGGAGSPSQLFRLIIMILSFLLLFKNKKFFNILIVVLFYIIIFESFMFLFHQSLYGYIVGLVYASKIVYLLLVFFTILYLVSIEKLSFEILLKYLNNYVFIVSVLLILSFLLGVGFPTYYEGTFGTKGFFSAGNGLGIFMGVGLLLSIYYWQYSRSKYSLIKSLVILFATVIIGTKTVFILSLVGLSAIVYYLKNKYLSVFIFFLILFFTLIFYQEIIGLISVVFDVIVRRLQNNDSLFSFIMSNRDVYFINAINNISFEGISFLRIIFGMGVYLSFRNLDDYFSGIDTLESDFADIFFMYGSIVLVIYLLIVLFILKKLFMKKQFFLCVIYLMLSGHSLIAGHVLFNGMSGVMLVFISALALIYKQEKLVLR